MSAEQTFLSPRMGHVQKIHFVGIAGTGMCGIAEVLHNDGYTVTGSDVSDNKVVDRLRALGITVKIGHDAQHVKQVDVVVRSTAIRDNNPEVLAAKKARIPVIPRAMMLAELMRFRQGIAIAGTHGKTTTTSLVSSLLAGGGLDPSFVIGGRLNSIGSNAKLGHSPYFVAEADESDASFLFLKPTIAVVTNIDVDHMETYNGDFKQLTQTFVEFLHHLPFYGLAAVCIDDKNVRDILPLIQRPTKTFGFSERAEYRAINWKQQELVSQFEVIRPKPHPTVKVSLQLPGRHNVLNTLAAITIATELGVGDEAIQKSLKNFQGVGRRFQLLGHRHIDSKQALVLDDYGHHPEEIRATIEAFRAVWPNKRLLHVFQPHRYSRTQALFSDFIDVLALSDELLLLDIYSAGESTIDGISSQAIAKGVCERFGKSVHVTNVKQLTQHLQNLIQAEDVILFQGAGSIGQIARQFMEKESH